jgi:excisionase family DNA binding protein
MPHLREISVGVATSPFFTAKEVCALLRIDRRTFTRWTTAAKRPRLTYVRNGHRILVSKADVDIYIAQRKTVAAA